MKIAAQIDETTTLVTRAAMSDGEILTRAREAYIAAKRPWKWMQRRIRRGWHDKRPAATVAALQDIDRPMALIISERDQAGDRRG